MAQQRKPIPKTQPELSNEYNGANAILGDPNLANPNFAGPNRSLQNSWEGDTVKPFTVGIQDLDEAIMYYFQNVIRPFVIQNGNRIEVPIIYGAPERWKSTQRDGYYKDKNGAIMAPLIMFKRNSIEKNRNIANKLDANYPNLYAVWKKKYTTKNFYSNFNVLNNRIPVKEMKVVAHPDYVTVTYELVIYTNFVEQLNRVIEAIQYAENSYWGDKNRYYFRVNATTFSTVNAYTVNEERTVSSKVTLTLHGYLIPDTINAFLSHDLNYVSKGQVVFNGESTLVPKTSLAVPFRIPISTNSNGDNVSQATLQAMSLYLSTNTLRNATLTGLFEATVYGASILLAPTTL
jgi:hypothetical protein